MNFDFSFIQIYDMMNTSFYILFLNHGHLKINANYSSSTIDRWKKLQDNA
jgi:hypothetical protein